MQTRAQTHKYNHMCQIATLAHTHRHSTHRHTPVNDALEVSQITKTPSSGLMGGMFHNFIINKHICLKCENMVFLCQTVLLYFSFL